MRIESGNTLAEIALSRLKPFLILTALLGAECVFAYSYSGRLTLGSYAGREHLAEASAGDNSNDAATASGRFFLRVADVTSNRFEFVSDIRDKHDFFGLVDKERLQLKDKNTLQVRELSAKYPGRLLYTQLGRFAVPEAGAVYTDGALQGVRITNDLRFSLFGGLNPKRPDQTYVQYNPNSQVYGTCLTFVPVFNGGPLIFSVDTAGVTNIVGSQTDRSYWYTNAIFQWSGKSRLSLFMYLDFVPNTYLQNGTINFQQTLTDAWTLAFRLFSIDVIEYQRLQSVRTQLASSPYKEANARVRYRLTSKWDLEAEYLTGHRDADGLSRSQWTLTSDFRRVFGPNWDFSLSAAFRKNFSSDDTFGIAKLSYSSNLWETELDSQYGVESYRNGSGTYHPLITELAISRIFENSLYGTFALQDARDERVTITSLFIKLSYRFGSKEIPPLRDGAPPRGQL